MSAESSIKERSTDITSLIALVRGGDRSAEQQLYLLVQAELEGVARRLRRGFQGSTLSTGDIVQQLAADWAETGRLGELRNRRYLFAAASDQMRRILVDHWRRRKAKKRGGDVKRVEVDECLDQLVDRTKRCFGDDLDTLEHAMDWLGRERPRQHEVVRLKYFAGLSNQQVAESLEISSDTVKRDWTIARARLRSIVCGDE